MSDLKLSLVLSNWLFVAQGAPHPPSLLMGDSWNKPYTREYAAYPASWLRSVKFWPTNGTFSISRFGDVKVAQTLRFYF